MLDMSGSGRYEPMLMRLYAIEGVPGRYSGLRIGPDVPGIHAAGYQYDDVGRLSVVSAPALPSGGVVYTYLPDSDLVERVEYSDGSGTVAKTTRTYEAERDLITSVVNERGESMPMTVVLRYAYVNDELSRRGSVVRTGVGESPSERLCRRDAP